MTPPGQQTAPPGWYPDPDGTPGRVRWWTGAGWSDVATHAGPGVTVQQPLGAPGATTGPPPSPLRPRPPARRAVWIAGAALLAVLLLAAAGLMASVLATGRDDVVAEPAPPAPQGPAFPPGTVRIVDEAAGISYPYLGEGWFEWDLAPQAQTTETAGQYFVTQERTPDGGMYITQCASGPLADRFGWAGPATLPSTTLAAGESFRATYFPSPNDRQVRRDETRTVDGHAAHLYEFDLAWDSPGFEASGERVAVLLVDVGRPAPAALFLSIPNTHAELYGSIDRVLADVDVL